MIHRRLVVNAAFCVVVAGCAAGGDEADRSPNIIYMLADDLGYTESPVARWNFAR